MKTKQTPTKTKPQTTKQIVWTLLLFYIFSYLLTCYTRVKYNTDLLDLFKILDSLTTLLLLSYIGKSSFENYHKGKNGDFTQSQQTQSPTPNNEQNNPNNY